MAAPARSARRSPSPSLPRPRSRLAGLRHVRRLKLLTAVFLMGCLAVGLVVFTLATTTADRSIERSRVDQSLRRQLAAARALPLVGPTGALDPRPLTTRPTLTTGYPQLYLVDLAPTRP